MIWTTYVIDDEEHSLIVLTDYIQRTPGLQLLGTATKPLEALHQISSGPAPDLIFADIDMPEISGLELAGLLPGSSQLVFITSFPEYAVDAFEKSARDYLLKPFSYERFLKCIQKVRSIPAAAAPPLQDDAFFVKHGKGTLYRLQPSKVIYVEADLNYIHIHLPEERLTVYLTLKEMEEKLPAGQFLRVHKSFLVNPSHIIVAEPGQLKMVNQHIVPVGRLFRPALSQKLESLTFTGRRAGL